MKKLLLSLLVSVFLAIPTASAEFIRSFDVDIQVHDADNMTVTETIEYDFETAWRHGIFRDVPEGSYEGITFLSITDENGTPHPYTSSRDYYGAHAKIGDPDVTITGPNTYVITYDAVGELGFFRDHDELYWNVNGTDWGVPIMESTATVTFPFGFDETDPQLQATCYTGYYGDSESGCGYTVFSEGDSTVFLFNTFGELDSNGYSNENMTIVAGIPRTFIEKKIQHEPWAIMHYGWTAETMLEKVLREAPFIAIALLLFFFTYNSWKEKGDDPAPKSPVVAQYKPPNNLTAAEMNILLTNSLQGRAVTATIFELGTKGILTIHETDRKALKFRLKRKPQDQELTEFQQYIYDKVFSKGSKDEVLFSALKHKLTGFSAYQKKIVDELIEKGYYATRPFTWHKIIFPFFGFSAFVLGIIFSTINDYRVAGITLIIAGLGTILFGIFMTKKTASGVELTQRIKGFRHFLEVTEKQRLAFHNPPAKTIKLFESMLPYAVAMGVEKKWMGSFEALIAQMANSNTHTWIHMTDLNVSSLNKAIGTLQRSTHTQSSSSGGGSGFSGGSSGGGGGGGGGGSW
jgi:uncharacterized membrane protein